MFFTVTLRHLRARAYQPQSLICRSWVYGKAPTIACFTHADGITSDMSSTSRYRHNPRIASMRRRRDGRALQRHGPTGPCAGLLAPRVTRNPAAESSGGRARPPAHAGGAGPLPAAGPLIPPPRRAARMSTRPPSPRRPRAHGSGQANKFLIEARTSGCRRRRPLATYC